MTHTPHPYGDDHGHPHEDIGRVVSRREALLLFASPLLLSFAGCDSGTDDEPLTGSCVVRPELTEGPYYVDADLLRSDIREDRAGVPLVLTFNVSRVVSNACDPLPNAIVDIWHADASGDYSGVGSLGSARFLRGIQQTDAGGTASFTTIYPGWYSGRTPHIHFKVRSSADSSSAYEFTSQLFFDDDLSREVYGSGAYAARGEQNTTNARDGIYDADMRMAVTESGGTYQATSDIALYVG